MVFNPVVECILFELREDKDSSEVPQAAELLRLCTSSLARFTILRNGEWGGVTTANGLGDGRGEFAECLPIWISRTLPLIGVLEAMDQFKYKYNYENMELNQYLIFVF